ncbi:hypothetical protein MNB_SV-6-230 [hydrothermal vent metagenome]|uniref:Uncharacterized protein n=1 Tax=hydrothermal vent metagenome TaxID=652676 RepID=A0A1W1CDS9_9ZZZZ
MYTRQIISILLILSISSSIEASSIFKVFDTKTAMINYKIKGKGKLTRDNYLSIDGNSTLLFDDWGMRRLYKEKYVEMTKGSVEKRKIISTLFLENRGDISRVDFKNKKINKSVDLIVKAAIKNGENLYKKSVEDMETRGTNIDTSTVMGYPCDIWLYENRKQCIYKGVPLREEYTVSGIKVIKEAISIDFDGNFSEDAFALPNFKEDKQKGFLMKEKRDAHLKNLKKIKDIVKDEISTTVEVDTEDVELDSGEKITEEIFQEQKSLLPRLLEEMQEARVCLEYADDRVSANSCLSKFVDIEEKISGKKNRDSEITIWTNIAKENKLDELEFAIMDMKRRMPCIRRSQNFVDLSRCMQDIDEE